MQNIFCILINPDDGPWTEIIDARHDAMRVCRKWHIGVLGYHLLWRRIILKRCMAPDFVKYCLLNTGTTMDLTFNIDGEVYKTVGRITVHSMSLDDFETKILRLIRPQFNRAVYLKLDGHLEIDVILRIIAGFPQSKLKRISFTTRGALEPGDLVDIPDIPGSAPTRMTFESTRPLWTSSAPYAKLKRLDLGFVNEQLNMGWSQLQTVLETSGALEEMHLRDVVCMGWEGKPTVALTHLWKFSLAYGDDSCIQFMANIVAPVVAHLTVTAHTYRTLPPLHGAIGHMFCTVTSISISAGSVAYEKDDIENILLLCKKATCLDLQGSLAQMMDTFVQLLRHPEFEMQDLRTLKAMVDFGQKTMELLFDGPFSPQLVVWGMLHDRGWRHRDPDHMEWVKEDGVVTGRAVYALRYITLW
jgi:hypothetical protein